MPYISKNNDRRERLRNGEPALIAGELNYQIFYYVKHNVYPNSYEAKKTYYERIRRTIKKFVDNFLGDKPNYQRYNDMTGCLIRCYKELRRRIYYCDTFEILLEVMDNYNDEIAKYEEKKCSENGDVE